MPRHANRDSVARWLLAALCLLALPPAGAGTHLVGLRQGTELTGKVRALGQQGYELSDGQSAGVTAWYRSSWTDTELAFLTPLQPDVGLLWGFSTGERGPKYRIDPSVHVGVLFTGRWGPRTRWSLRATTLLGGRLREQACVADYGEVGGVQAVNCRLAASELQPAETLRYLINEGPANRTRVSLRLVHDF